MGVQGQTAEVVLVRPQAGQGRRVGIGSVSVRTYRDLEHLGEAGAPVWGERGVGGGFSLLQGWRTELSGLTDPEAAVARLVFDHVRVAAAALLALAPEVDVEGPPELRARMADLVGRMARRLAGSPPGAMS